MFSYVCVFFISIYLVCQLNYPYVCVYVQVLFTSIWSRVISGGDIEALLRWLMVTKVESK